MINDLIGQKRGKLWAIGVNCLRESKTHLITYCECGRYDEVEIEAFEKQIYNCKCDKSKPIIKKENVKDFIEYKFGQWTVKEKLENRKGVAYYLCACECGNTKEIAITNLTQRNGGSCKACKPAPIKKKPETKKIEEPDFSGIINKFKAMFAERYLDAQGYGHEVATVLAPKPQEAALTLPGDAEAPLSEAAQSLKGIFDGLPD